MPTLVEVTREAEQFHSKDRFTSSASSSQIPGGRRALYYRTAVTGGEKLTALPRKDVAVIQGVPQPT